MQAVHNSVANKFVVSDMHVACLLPAVCRLCKLAPEVEQVLDDNNIQYIVTLAAPPDCVTASLIQRIEGGLCIASLGGNEGRYPGTDHEELMRFAQEVRAASQLVA